MNIALLIIASGEQYHEFARPLIESANKYFFGGKYDALLWTDDKHYEGEHVFEIEHMPRPFPTLMRYHFFLSQVKKLHEYDYLFYCDIDALFVAPVGEEILGDLVATISPMYRKDYAPFEPNPKSSAYVSKEKQGVYYAGGFQGGRTSHFVKAMKVMKRNIDKDLEYGYVAIWSEESHFNRYLINNPPTKVLTPSYCFPDSALEEYYYKIWPKIYESKIVMLTKRQDLSIEGGKAMQEAIKKL